MKWFSYTIVTEHYIADVIENNIFRESQQLSCSEIFESGKSCLGCAKMCPTDIIDVLYCAAICWAWVIKLVS